MEEQSYEARITAGRRGAVYDALSADEVMTAGTLKDAHMIEPHEVKALELYTTTRRVDTPIEESDGPRVTFVMLEDRFLQLSTRQLCMTAGMAELRHQLGVQPHTWELWGDFGLRKGFAKGLWFVGEDERIAVDYDIGSESLKKLAARARIYQAYHLTQIWGAPTRKRCETLERVLKATVPSVEVRYAPYASGVTWEPDMTEEEREAAERRDDVRIAAFYAELDARAAAREQGRLSDNV